jgi:hypothetical protein
MSETTVFTLNEAMVTHQALLTTKLQLEKDSHRIKNEHGTDVYDSIYRDCLTALTKVQDMVHAARERAAQEALNTLESGDIGINEANGDQI